MSRHSVTLDLKLTVSRSGTREASEQLIEYEVQLMLDKIRDHFLVEYLKLNVVSQRRDETNAARSEVEHNPHS